MRKDKKPTEEHLKELYDAASAFKQVQPWKWLNDTDIICVENPIDKTMGYCSVMGRAGEHYALGVYLGNEGFFGFCYLIENADIIPLNQTLHYQKCLMCSFEDRDQLANEDRNQIKSLGLAFRGRNAWPMFRRYDPGYFPWFLNDEECIFLTHALRQVLFVAGNISTDQLRMYMNQGKTIVRYSEEKNGKLEWFSKEVQLGIPSVTYSPVTISDDLLIQRIKKAGNMHDITLQADTRYVPSPVQENKGERPYFPRAFILAERNSMQIWGFETYQNINEDANVTLHKLIELCLRNGIPKEIQVRRGAMPAFLGDFCKKTGIKLKVVKRLPVIDEMIEELASRFGQ